MPPASEAGQAVPSKQPLSLAVQSLMDSYAKTEQKDEERKEKEKKKRQKKADRLLMAPPRMALPRSGAGQYMQEQMDMMHAHQVLIETDDQVPPDATHPIIEPLQQLISPLPTLPVSPEPDPLHALKEMPVNIMEHEDAAPKKQANVEEVSTCHSAKSSLTHGLVQRGCPNIFGDIGRILPISTDTSPPSGPSGSMDPPRHPPPCRGPLLQLSHAQSQSARQATPLGALVPLLEQPFAALAGLSMGILMPPLAGLSPPLRVAGLPNRQRRLLGAQTLNLLLDLLAIWDGNDGHLHLLDRCTEI